MNIITSITTFLITRTNMNTDTNEFARVCQIIITKFNYYGTNANTFAYVSENIQTRQLNFYKTCLCKIGARLSIQID